MHFKGLNHVILKTTPSLDGSPIVARVSDTVYARVVVSPVPDVFIGMLITPSTPIYQSAQPPSHLYQYTIRGALIDWRGSRRKQLGLRSVMSVKCEIF